MSLLSLMTALATLARYGVDAVPHTSDTPSTLHNGTTVAHMTSVAGGLDAPKLLPVNANETTYDWWYFDAVSASSEANVQVIFYNSGPQGFFAGFMEGGPFSVGLTGSWPNGTSFVVNVPATGGAVVENGREGIRAEWRGSGWSFAGSSLYSPNVTYVMTVDAPEYGLEGNITLRSRAPAHNPCGLDGPGQTLQVLPHVGWANAIPDADATVNLRLNGTALSFTDGVGYHDKNWGDIPFRNATSTWYWGHARFGPYSAVWFDAREAAPPNTEHFSSYVVRDGTVLTANCLNQSVVVRPWGANSTYPPTPQTGPMEGITAVFDLGAEGILRLNVTTGVVVAGGAMYLRTTGDVAGGLVGGPQYTGRTLFEEFKFPAQGA